MKKRILAILAIIVILAISLIPQIALADTAWLTGYDHTQQFTLSRASGAVVNYQMMITVENSVGASTGSTIYTGGNMTNFPNDFRVTTSDGETLLDQWLEGNDTDTAWYWVEFDSIGTSATTFYAYYGDIDAALSSDGETTFLFFDNFNDASIDAAKWSPSGGTAESGGYLVLNGSGGDDYATGKTTFDTTRAVRYRLQRENDGDKYNAGWNTVPNWTTYAIWAANKAQDADQFFSATFKVAESVGLSDAFNTNWYTWDVCRNGSTDVRYYKDNTLKVTEAAQVPTDAFAAFFRAGDTATDQKINVDWVAVRYWLVTEPAFGSWTYISVPTLELLTIGDITHFSAILNGNITATGGINATVRGFKYDTDSGAPYSEDTHEDGDFGVGNFTASISGLTPSTLYYYVAYATNIKGTGYSAEGNFTTDFLPLPDAPENLTATQTGVGNITITWDMGLWAEDTIIRIDEDTCPGNITEGYLVYNGDGTTATYSGLSLGIHEYCIRAWSSNFTGNSTGYAEVKIGGTGMTALGNIILLGILMFASLACTISAYAFRKTPVAFLGAGLWALLGFFAFTLSTSPSPTQITDIYMGIFWLSMGMVMVSVFEPAIMKAPSIDEPEPEAELSQADQMKTEYAAMQKEMGVGIFTSRRKRRRLPRL